MGGWVTGPTHGTQGRDAHTHARTARTDDLPPPPSVHPSLRPTELRCLGARELVGNKVKSGVWLAGWLSWGSMTDSDEMR